MIIEFIGMPGSGKSALRDAVVKSLKKKMTGGWRFVTSDEAFALVCRTLMDKPLPTLLKMLPNRYVVNFANRFRNRSIMQYRMQNRFLAVYGPALCTYLAAKSFVGMNLNDRQNAIDFFLSIGSLLETVSEESSRGKVIFFPEGLVQKTLIFLNLSEDLNTNGDEVKNYLMQIPRPDLLIHVHADPNTCLSRLCSRPRGLPKRLMGLNKQETLNFLVRAETHLEMCVQILHGDYGIDTLHVDNHASLEEAVSQLHRLLSLREGL